MRVERIRTSRSLGWEEERRESGRWRVAEEGEERLQ